MPIRESNPYAAPEGGHLADDPAAPLADYPPDRLKKLYYRSCNVSGVAGILIIGTALVAYVLTTIPGDRQDLPEGIVWAVLGFNVLAIVGIIMRTGWGRVLGIIVCMLMLIRIPIGTIVGLMGLFAFFGAGELFGPNRIKHRDLKIAFKAMKQRGRRR